MAGGGTLAARLPGPLGLLDLEVAHEQLQLVFTVGARLLVDMTHMGLDGARGEFKDLADIVEAAVLP